jgi:putative ABC transport system permease protein
MLGYYLKLAYKSAARTPGLTLLMITAIALGIGVCVTTMTIYHAMSGNPIWWKNDRLYAVTMDSWEADHPSKGGLPPAQLTYRDATALLSSPVPRRKAIMYTQRGVLSGGTAEHKPVPVRSRVTTSDFFALLDVPFLYGAGWTAAADTSADPVLVLSREENQTLFGGINSVGKTIRWNDREFRIVGVLDTWNPMPKFYDLNTGALDSTEDVYVPFGWTRVREQRPNGSVECRGDQAINTFNDFLASECTWLQMWVELPDRASHARMQALIDQYWAEQRRLGRFPRPRNNRLTNVGQWLTDQGVVANDDRLLVGIAFAFLGVCLINTVGILLARFLSIAALTGVRRALGASRKQIFAQHLVEVGLIACSGALLGLALGALGLDVVRGLFSVQVGTDTSPPGGYRALTHFDTVSITWAVALAILSTLAAGIYPAWRVGRLPPATYLKSQ